VRTWRSRGRPHLHADGGFTTRRSYSWWRCGSLVSSLRRAFGSLAGSKKPTAHDNGQRSRACASSGESLSTSCLYLPAISDSPDVGTGPVPLTIEVGAGKPVPLPKGDAQSAIAAERCVVSGPAFSYPTLRRLGAALGHVLDALPDGGRALVVATA
jgi:hypothetical protein